MKQLDVGRKCNHNMVATAINRLGDAAHVDEVLQTWQRGTAMAENATKREGQLLGKLNREKHRAPSGVIAHDAWLADGYTIRALGCPMGNSFDETAWWIGRYRTVKSRIASWHHIGSLSITGRNLLLQSIYFGSFRFWLYFMVMPTAVIKLLDSDAKEILWASNPELCSDEVGTGKKSNRWIREMASYKSIKRGGAGVMHWPSHCQAFYAQWIIRFMHP